MEKIFAELSAVNVNEYTEKKNGLTYLSWVHAIREVKKRYPDFSYEIVRDPLTNLPYSFDPQTGYMVFTRVTIGGVTHEMFLPVMDSANNAMKAEPYDIQTKYKTVHVNAATMFDINKTLMRCLVKNLAIFGLGLYIYAGEDLPEDAEPERKEPMLTAAHAKKIKDACIEKWGADAGKRLKDITGITDLKAVPDAQYEKIMELIK